jgi:hypothetical protein
MPAHTASWEFKMYRRCRHEPRNDAVGKSRNEIWFKGHRWYAPAQRGHHRRTGGVSAHANDYIRLKFVQHPACGKHSARQIEKRFQPGRQAYAIERPDFDELQGKAGRWNQSVFKPARGTNEKHLGLIPILEFLCDGDRWNDMTAGASPRQNGSHEENYIRVTCRAMLLSLLGDVQQHADATESDEQ